MTSITLLSTAGTTKLLASDFNLRISPASNVIQNTCKLWVHSDRVHPRAWQQFLHKSRTFQTPPKSLPSSHPSQQKHQIHKSNTLLLQPLSRHSSLFFCPPSQPKSLFLTSCTKSQQKQNPPTSTHSLQEDQSLRHLHAQECATTRIALTKSVQFTGSSNSSRAKETLSLSLSLKSQ